MESHPRLHLDLFVESATEQEAEVERLVALGAKKVDWDRYPPHADFVVLADPDGNVFCGSGRRSNAWTPRTSWGRAATVLGPVLLLSGCGAKYTPLFVGAGVRLAACQLTVRTGVSR